MTFADRLKQFRTDRGLTQQQVSDMLGVQKATYSGYETGRREPDVFKIKELSRIFGVTGDELLGTGFSSELKVDFTSEELDHIKKYRALDEHGKKMVNLVLEEESDRMNAEKIVPIAENIIELYEYLTPVSAGNGVIALEDSPKNITKVIDNAYTRKSNYIVRVKGDSMIPRYFDGDKLLIQSAGIPNFGEVGIWYVDGQTYVKQAGHGELLSLNNNYEPIKLRGKEYRCQGKVIGILDPEWVK